ncbi:hypothetical protein Enr13x_23400 [Stieleria neptunia]|uniref:Uncharacterized protein n=1 Tax=Stieleria neptunia TaxID=2527979 RepID=A0A518HNS4_9BACT|nr:hypothetical protein Enr13x_23400 [Stieleria neptunia]
MRSRVFGTESARQNQRMRSPLKDRRDGPLNGPNWGGSTEASGRRHAGKAPASAAGASRRWLAIASLEASVNRSEAIAQGS